MVHDQYCKDCSWEDHEWEGGKASDDPAMVHLFKNPDHTVTTDETEAFDE